MSGCPRTDTKWWGWGANEKRTELTEEQLAPLRDELGVDAGPTSAVPAIEQVKLPAPRALPSAVRAAAGEGGLLTDAEQRVRHSAGKSYPDLIRMRSGELEHAPDAIALPGSAEQLEAILAACSDENVAVVPFGGGTSVVGGVDPRCGGRNQLISLDLCRMRALSVDPISMTARIGPGLRGPEAEAALGAEGFTLGHFPQSFEYATIGGFAATRSAGQASAGYGRFDELVTAVTMAAPAGRISTLQTPHTAAGPALREVVLGSEGVFGVIDEVTVRVRRVPEAKRYETWFAADFESGREIVRSLAQSDCLADITRLSDEEETRFFLGLSIAEGTARRRGLDGYLKLRRRQGGCMMILGWEGERESVRRRRSLTARMLREGGAVPLGQSAGRSWEHGRYNGPYLRDELLDRGVMVETLETSHTWSRLPELYKAVGDGLRQSLTAGGTPPIVLCHLSHAYADGASLYYTFLARKRPGEEIEQWREAKTAACEAIVASGATITHHHAVGSDHAPYMSAEVGELGLGALQALKERFDPAGVMNPGKLITEPA